VDICSREEIRFEFGHFQIVGDLHIPYPDKQQPAIIFVHGDGPASRRASRAPNQIMSHFLDIGFACLFYDKPGYGESTGKFTRGKLFEERSSILVEAVRVLKNHPSINPKQIGLWGISQAGWVMPKAIAKTKDIAFMIAISCAGIDGVEQSAYLVEKQILCNGYDEEEAKKARQHYRQRAHAKTYEEYLEAAEYLDKNPVISSMGWGGIEPEDQFSPRTPFNEGFFNPIPLIEKMTIPVLAIYGEKDTQVDPFQAYEAYKKALKKGGNPLNHVEIFPEADHGIFLSKTGCIKEQRERWRSGNSRGYAPGYIELMQNWMETLKDSFQASEDLLKFSLSL
jgi:pimeloyl-ACP methyl ester carboxylesterase